MWFLRVLIFGYSGFFCLAAVIADRSMPVTPVFWLVLAGLGFSVVALYLLMQGIVKSCG